jgi:hypothetical protein
MFSGAEVLVFRCKVVTVSWVSKYLIYQLSVMETEI